MRNIIICCDGTGNEISENISNVLKLYRCLRKTEKTQPQKQRGWPMVERRDLFRICQTLPISDAEKIADLRAEMPARQFVKFYRSSARSWNLAYAAPAPACAAAADPAASAATYSAATYSAPTAAPATTATPANNNGG
jgi:hypothetical protein